MQLDQLTNEIIDRLEAGVELDRLVAEAMGWETRPRNKWRRFMVGVIDADTGTPFSLKVGGLFPFRPSTDMDDAMLAAEKVGLFRETLALDQDGNSWRIIHIEAGGRHEGFIVSECATAPTPALAICRAILKLHLEKKAE